MAGKEPYHTQQRMSLTFATLGDQTLTPVSITIHPFLPTKGCSNQEFHQMRGCNLVGMTKFTLKKMKTTWATGTALIINEKHTI